MVQTGAKTYQIADQDGNDLGVFRFIPSDAGILKRYKEAAAFFAGINDKIKDKDFEEILPDLEKEAGEKIDLLFGAPVSESFFKIPVRLPFSTAEKCSQNRLLLLSVESSKKNWMPEKRRSRKG